MGLHTYILVICEMATGLCLASIGILILCYVFKYIPYRRGLPICQDISEN